MLLWSIPKTGADLPQSRLTVMTPSQATNQAFTKSAIDIYFIQEKRYGSDEVQGNPGANQGTLQEGCQRGVFDTEGERLGERAHRELQG
jgi:hypothetical protein